MDEDFYIVFESSGEMPPKRGRGRGRGAPPGRSSEAEGSGQQSENPDRRGALNIVSSLDERLERSLTSQTERPNVYEHSSLPSTSRHKESHKGHKVAPEDSFKFKQRSDKSHKNWTETSSSYQPSSVPSTSTAKEYHKHKAQHVAPEDTDFIYKQKSFEKSHKTWTETSHSYHQPSSVPSTSTAKEYYKAHHVAPDDIAFKYKQKSSDESHRSWTEKSQYHKSSVHSTSSAKEYHKAHKKIPDDSSFKYKYKAPDESSRKWTEKSCDYESSASSSSKDSRHKFKLESSEESQRSSKHSAEKSYDYEPFSMPSSAKEYTKAQKVSAEDVGFKYKQRSSEASLFPVRPGFGKEGRHIKVISNLFPLEFPRSYVFHYDVEIIETNRFKQSGAEHKKYRCLNTKRNREVIAYMLGNHPTFKGFCGAFDGQKNLLLRKQLKTDLPFSCTVQLPNENFNSQDPKYDTFKVEIKSLVSEINLDSINAFYEKRCSALPQEAIMALEVILRHSPCLKFTPIGRCFFSPDLNNITPFGGGLEIWFGYHQSIRLSQWRPTVNLDTAATAFWQAGPLLNNIAEFMNMRVSDLRKLRYLNRHDVKRISQKLKQKHIKVTHLSYGRKYRIVRVRDLSANQEYTEITDERGNKRRMTVEQYFKDKYGKDLEYSNLPCVQVKPENKNIFMPIEVCELVQGQHYKGEFTQAQKAKMIEFTAKPPHERFKKIQDIVEKVNFNEDETVKGFGIKVSDRPLIADARVLDAPRLVYKTRDQSEKCIQPENGQWNVRETHFLRGAKISSWVLLSFQEDRNLKVFSEVLARIAGNLGLKIGMPTDIIVINNVNCDKEKLFHDLKKKKAEFAVIVIPKLEEGAEKQLYGEIKKAAETVVGLTTQCIKAERLRHMSGKLGPQIANNLCLKINAKLGGENHSLFDRDIPKILCRPVMIIGADVNHPAVTQPNQPSIAACVGSLDCLGKRFAVSLQVQVNSNAQKKKVEKICDLENMVYDLLLAFHHHTRGKKPEKIVFYRDGVSEGELVTVKTEEVSSIRKACRRLSADYEPGITAIVVQKRHHVRFKPKYREDGVRSNIPPGTVIDTEVTHPKNFDFFLCSQLGIQGTSRPCHYLVLEDDNNLSADDLQKLTFYMCHMYAACTKSISIPTPVAYADRVAFRARAHLNTAKGTDSSSSDCSQSYRLTQADFDAIDVVKYLKDSMYFV